MGLTLNKKLCHYRFEELNIWQRAFKLANEIDLIVEVFPKKELFSLSSQTKRAADSVVLNIAEGSTGQTKSEFKRFLNIALRSAIEVVACLMMANERKYLNKEQFKNFYDEYEILCKMITKFRNGLN